MFDIKKTPLAAMNEAVLEKPLTQNELIVGFTRPNPVAQDSSSSLELYSTQQDASIPDPTSIIASRARRKDLLQRAWQLVREKSNYNQWNMFNRVVVHIEPLSSEIKTPKSSINFDPSTTIHVVEDRIYLQNTSGEDLLRALIDFDESYSISPITTTKVKGKRKKIQLDNPFIEE